MGLASGQHEKRLEYYFLGIVSFTFSIRDSIELLGNQEIINAKKSLSDDKAIPVRAGIAIKIPAHFLLLFWAELYSPIVHNL